MSYWYRQRLMKHNPYHDDEGKFASADTSQIKQAEGLSPHHREVEGQLTRQLRNFQRAVADYTQLKDSKGGKILNTDVARELSRHYLGDSTLSAAVHEPASWFIKKLYTDELAQAPREGELPLVLFTAGGTGAGKTTAVDTIPEMKALSDQAQIIYDTNMNTYASAKNKVEQALDAGKQVHIAVIQRDPVDALVNGALPRAMRQEKEFGSGRTVPIVEHVKTHLGVTSTIKQLQKDYAGDSRVQFSLIDNSRGKGEAVVVPMSSLHELDYTRTESAVSTALEKEHDSGKISDAIYKGFKGHETS